MLFGLLFADGSALSSSNDPSQKEVIPLTVPSDPFILLSYINTQLRDFCSNLTDLCRTLELDQNQLVNKLADIGYLYDPKRNQFV